MFHYNVINITHYFIQAGFIPPLDSIDIESNLSSLSSFNLNPWEERETLRALFGMTKYQFSIVLSRQPTLRK